MFRIWKVFWIVLFATLIALAFFLFSDFQKQTDGVTGGWNPTVPLNIQSNITPLTRWKLKQAVSNKVACIAALQTSAAVQGLQDLEISESCHVRDRIRLSSVSAASFGNLETRCDLALILAMWMEHGVQPAALEIFGMPVKSVRTQGSYNCRKIAGTSRMSKHAQAKAIDIAGFTLVNGRKINLIDHWGNETEEARFLLKTRDTACDWFKTTLGPEFNRAHADHFHLQSEGWGTCR